MTDPNFTNRTSNSSTASPEELDELDRFDCGLLTLEDRGKFLAKLYADEEKRRSLSEMFDLELLRRPELDDLQDAPADSNDAQTRGVGLRPRWSENPSALKALLALSTTVCVLCVLYIMRPNSAPLDVVRRVDVVEKPLATKSAEQESARSFSQRKTSAAREQIDFAAENIVAESEEDAAETDYDAFSAVADATDEEVGAFSDDALQLNKKVDVPRLERYNAELDAKIMSEPRPHASAFAPANSMNRGMGGGVGSAMTGGGMRGSMSMHGGGMGGGASLRAPLNDSLSDELTGESNAAAIPDAFKRAESNSLSDRVVSEAKRRARALLPTLDLETLIIIKDRRKNEFVAIASDDALPLAAPEEESPTVDDDSTEDALWTIRDLFLAGKFQEARAAWERLPQEMKDGFYGKTYRGILLYFDGEYEDAERVFGEACEMKPGDFVAAHNRDLARLALEKQDGEKTDER